MYSIHCSFALGMAHLVTRSSRYYGHFFWPLAKRKTFSSKKKPCQYGHPLIRPIFLAHCWLVTVLTRLYCSCNLPCFYWCTCFPKIQCTCINAKQLSVKALHFDSKVANKHYQHSITQSKPPFHVNDVTYVKK